MLDVTIKSGVPYIDGKKGTRVTNGNSPTGGHHGAWKIVYFFDDYVVKFNDMSEAKLFIHEEDRKHFAEVVYVDIDQKWYVQRRVNCIPNAEVSSAHTRVAQELSRKYGFTDVGDLGGRYYGTKENIRIGHNYTLDLDGVPVIYDYAGF